MPDTIRLNQMQCITVVANTYNYLSNVIMIQQKPEAIQYIHTSIKVSIVFHINF